VARVLVAGSAGMLAQDLIPRLVRRGHSVISPPEREFDITSSAEIGRTVTAVAPDLLINCAAYNFVDLAEKESARANQVNGYAVRDLCLACRERDIPIVHFSTDYVFDGMKDHPYVVQDRPCPINAYGRSKALGEKFVVELMSRFYLVRTSWLFGLHGRNFVETILAKAHKEGRLAVVDGEVGCPTWTVHLAEAVVDLIETGRSGVYHAVNSSSTTWHDFAEAILRLSRIDVPLRRTSAEKLGRAARRPAYSVLDQAPLPEVLNRGMPSWQEALREYFVLRGEPRRGD